MVPHKRKKKLWEEGKYSRIDTMPIWIEGGGGSGGVEESRIELIENKLIYATSTLLYSTPHSLPSIQTDHNCKLFVNFFFLFIKQIKRRNIERESKKRYALNIRNSMMW